MDDPRGAKVIELLAKRATLISQPVNLWALRWRLVTDDGMSIQSAWTPETRYPLISETLAEFEGRVAYLAIDGRNIFDGTSFTMLRCPGDQVVGISFKVFGSFASGREFIGGIEVETVLGERYLVLRDGTIHVEGEATASHVANDH